MSKSGFNAREVDASEYEPQIVKLPSPEAEPSGKEDEEEDGVTGSSTESGSEDSSSDSRSSRSSSEEPAAAEKERPASNGKVGSSERVGSMELTEKEREEQWVKKLGEMRERYLATMTEKEKEDFFKLLDV